MKQAFFLILFFSLLSTAKAQEPVDTANIYYGKPTEIAEFKSKLNGWLRFLELNLDRDVTQRNGAPEGRYTVVVDFVLSEKGEVLYAKSDMDPGYGTKEAAISVIKKSTKNWIPAKVNGMPVRTWQRQSITFICSY